MNPRLHVIRLVAFAHIYDHAVDYIVHFCRNTVTIARELVM